MKNIFATVLSVLLFVNIAQANLSEVVISDTSDVGQFLIDLSYSAEDGSPLALFETSYKFWQPSFDVCETIDAATAVERASTVVIETYEEATSVSFGDAANIDLLTLKNGLSDFFAGKTYYYCYDSASIFMGFNQYYRFVSTDYKTRLQFQKGYED